MYRILVPRFRLLGGRLNGLLQFSATATKHYPMPRLCAAFALNSRFSFRSDGHFTNLSPLRAFAPSRLACSIK